MKFYQIICGNEKPWTNFFRIMKLTVILLFGSLVAMSATTYSQNTDAANKFVAYVASDEGKAFFAKHGFPIYPDPIYAGITP